MDALILAGGYGTRLKEIIPDTQKVVAEVKSRPFITYILKELYSEGVRRVILALGYKAEETLKIVLDFVPEDMVIIPSVEIEPLGTAGAIRNALPFIKSEELLIVNGDSIINFSLKRLVDFHKKNNALVSMILCKVKDIRRYGNVILNKNYQIESFKEKISDTKNPEGLINAGIYIFPKNLIAKMPIGFASIEENIFPNLCGKGLYGFEIDSDFIDIGTPDAYQKAQSFFD